MATLSYMRLLCFATRPRGWWLTGLLVSLASSLGACAHQPVDPSARLPGWALDTRPAERPRPRFGVRGRSESSDFVVAALQTAGLRFGTDGTVTSLWQYLRSAHPSVEPVRARPGDVLLFRVAPAPVEADACEAPDAAAIVTAVDESGRIGFIEARGGRKLLSYVDPLHPGIRRDAEGQVRNSFLRTPRWGEPLDAPLLAGQMLCAVARPLG